MKNKILGFVFAFVLFSMGFFVNGVSAATPKLTISDITQNSATITASGLDYTLQEKNPNRYSIMVLSADPSILEHKYGIGLIDSDGKATITATDLIHNTEYFAYIKDNTVKNGLIINEQIPFKTKKYEVTPIHNEKISAISSSTSVVLTLTGLETQNVYYIALIRLDNSNTYIDNKIISAAEIKESATSVKFDNLSPSIKYAIDLDKYTTIPPDGYKITPPVTVRSTFTTLSTAEANAAKIISFSPTEGSAGDLITIKGENFDGLKSVFFGSTEVPVENTHIISPKEITVKVPTGSVVGKITVKTEKHGDAVSAESFKFTAPAFSTSDIVTITAIDITPTSVTLVSSGKLTEDSYNFEIFDAGVYNDTSIPLKEWHALRSVQVAVSDMMAAQGYIEATFSGLDSNKEYIGILDFRMGPQYDFAPIVKFTTPKVGTVATSATQTTPSSSVAAVTSTDDGKGIVPKCNVGPINMDTGQYETPCNFKYFMDLINAIIKFLLFTIATPLVALIIMYTGYLYLSAGGSASQTEKAKHIFLNVIVGYVIALGAWLIINAILSALNVDTSINTFLKK